MHPSSFCIFSPLVQSVWDGHHPVGTLLLYPSCHQWVSPSKITIVSVFISDRSIWHSPFSESITPTDPDCRPQQSCLRTNPNCIPDNLSVTVTLHRCLAWELKAWELKAWPLYSRNQLDTYSVTCNKQAFLPPNETFSDKLLPTDHNAKALSGGASVWDHCIMESIPPPISLVPQKTCHWQCFYLQGKKKRESDNTWWPKTVGWLHLLLMLIMHRSFATQYRPTSLVVSGYWIFANESPSEPPCPTLHRYCLRQTCCHLSSLAELDNGRAFNLWYNSAHFCFLFV